MNQRSWQTIAVFSLLLSACGSAPDRPASAPQAAASSQLELALKSGIYTCEQNIRIQVVREIQKGTNTRIDITWNGNSYRLERDASFSGLPRFEGAARDWVWVDLPWKSLLLDGKTNTPLLNECRIS